MGSKTFSETHPSWPPLYETYINWIEEASVTYEEIEKKLPSMEVRIAGPNEVCEDNLKYQGMIFISGHASLSFFYGCLKSFKDADYFCQEADDFIEACYQNYYIPDEYFDGIDYVFHGLGSYLKIKKAEENGEVLNIDMPEDNFNRLSDKAKAAVLCMKQHFYHLFRENKNIQLLLLERIIALDPHYYAWHHYFYAGLRYKRRETSYHHHNQCFLGDLELESMLTAEKLCPGHPHCLIDICLVLAEVIKRQKNDGPFQLGRFRFPTSRELVKFLNEKCRQIRKDYPQSDRVHMHIAQIFSVLLPPQFRDFDFTKECLEDALKLNPRCSKTNHRIGIYHLTAPRKINLNEARKYFHLGVKYDDTNFRCLMDYLQLCLVDIEGNRDVIRETFDRELNNISHSPHRLGQLHFLKGIYCFMHSDPKAQEMAISCWVRAEEVCEDNWGGKFENMDYQSRRYCWLPGILSSSKICKVIHTCMNQCGDKCHLMKLQNMIITVENAEVLNSRYHRRIASKVAPISRLQ